MGLENHIYIAWIYYACNFNDLMTFEQATNGFMARAMIFLMT